MLFSINLDNDNFKQLASAAMFTCLLLSSLSASCALSSDGVNSTNAPSVYGSNNAQRTVE